MIIVCEAICKGISHEKFNSGFLYGLSLAFPSEEIFFYADASHINAIKNILANDDVKIENLRFKKIKIYNHFSSLIEIIFNHLLFLIIFSEMRKNKIDKIFFLSVNSNILYSIHNLKKIWKFLSFKFTFVLHGAFEEISNGMKKYKEEIVLPKLKISTRAKRPMLEKLKTTSLLALFKKIIKISTHLMGFLPKKRILISFKEAMLLCCGNNYKYITLAPHIIKNAATYIDIDNFQTYCVTLPTIFKPALKKEKNKYVKFAVFGFGDSLVLHNILYALSLKNITKQYEIKIIGMDNRGTQGFQCVTTTSSGNQLSRTEMESHAIDIDFFLILYNENRYTLSCSGSILEALSMSKPILHFKNECISVFNDASNPIGFSCSSFDEYVNKLVDIIENFDAYNTILDTFNNNIIIKRNLFSIENSISQIKASFSW